MSPDSHRFDAVVVGGGIYGVLLALEGASRDQRVLLLERDDFGSGATSNHLRTIHGGLRYLQSLDVRRAVMSHRERLWWLRTFPDLVYPITCLMPLYGRGLRRPGTFRAAFGLARVLGLASDSDGAALSMRIVSTEEVRRRLPCGRQEGMNGGAQWRDAFMPRPHRIMAELLHWAENAGVLLRNRTELVSARDSGKRDRPHRWRVHIRHLRSGESEELAARWVINAAGAGAEEVIRRIIGLPRAHIPAPTLAWNLLLNCPPLSDCSVAVSAPGRNRRTWFIHPYHGRVLAGTGQAGVPAGEAPPNRLAELPVRQNLAELNEALPGAALSPVQVDHVFLGVLPGVRAGSEHLLKHARIIDHGGTDGAPGAFTVFGVKFTEAPSIAKMLWDGILGRQPRSLPPRPPPVPVPSIEEARAMSDDTLAAALRRIAAAEWRPDADDMSWRRTDLWMDETQVRRVSALKSLWQVDGPGTGNLPSRRPLD